MITRRLLVPRIAARAERATIVGDGPVKGLRCGRWYCDGVKFAIPDVLVAPGEVRGRVGENGGVPDREVAILVRLSWEHKDKSR